MTEKTKRLYYKFTALLSAAMNRDAEAVADMLAEIGQTEGDDGVYAICCALAHSVVRLGFPDAEPGDGILDGDMMVVETMEGFTGPTDAAALWACRFVAAWFNGDRDTCLTYFCAEADLDQFARNVWALIGMAACVARAKEPELS